MQQIPDEKFREEKRREYLENPAIEYIPLGKSILQKRIDLYKIGKGKRAILAVGAHHALEYISSQSLYAFIDFLAENLTRPRTFFGVSIEFLLNLYSFYIVPTLNVDGVDIVLHKDELNVLSERQRRLSGGDMSLWQANARGVDLNHNYNCGFLEYKRIEAKCGILAGSRLYSGEYPESEPETRALANFVRFLMPSYILSFHSQGREIFYNGNDARALRLAQRLGESVGYSVKTPVGTAAYGGLCDYTSRALNIPSFTVELGLGKNPLPESALREAVLTARKLLILLPTLA